MKTELTFFYNQKRLQKIINYHKNYIQAKIEFEKSKKYFEKSKDWRIAEINKNYIYTINKDNKTTAHLTIK